MATRLADYASVSEEQWLESCIRRGSTGFFGTQVELTPRLAGALLANNPANRAVTQTRVKQYAADILAGRWAFNGEPVIVSRDGRLVDGQHRALAVIEAEKPITTAMSFGVDYGTRTTTDQNRTKGASDYAGMDGVIHATTTAAIARMVLCFRETGQIRSAGRLTNSQVLEFVFQNREALEHAARFSHNFAKQLQPLISCSPFGFAYFVCRDINADAADLFYRSVATGENLTATDPAYVVRSRLMALGKAPRVVKTELVLHGWNAFRRGQVRAMVKSTGALPKVI